ncbi:hypothetical protein K4K49_003755 [Colletotrichum sp. SAR 10_70]|nr:hypothetical protein K4K50_006688 [Colletotrichum sp. SAR 10_71]KAI8190686.1 hypothetical protein K4K51_001056 [Colletotrichum sp. SAR 10_75]KAI8204320.1 hypothetical protein K4K49_003755 [Colletotrichum sp. SAR 10_70]KAI8217992.1 hypothetical protein K4K54_010937 [Colletotrichum sp. SAR 10_86]KAI8263757.1 hypothetical protein K4K53_006151 [Colletotrichum sp. SAR 10_77]KAJ5001758.1 hypothetical protein K4K48_000940 [Colletotrichum sp. SAR 10_66]
MDEHLVESDAEDEFNTSGLLLPDFQRKHRDHDSNQGVALLSSPSVSDSCDSVQDVDDECIICKQPTLRTCALCNEVMICSMDCQQIAVIDDVNSDHFDMCVAETSADTLYKDVLSNRIPRDTETFNDYQFYWLFTFIDRRKLLKIYSTMIRKMDVTPHEMEIWVKEHKLFERIAMFFLSRPDLITLDDLTWLKRTYLWTDGFSNTARGIFEDVIARKQEKLQSD